jgi:hypothetical protein
MTQKDLGTSSLSYWMLKTNLIIMSSVADSDPDPPDPHVFRSPGSGSGSTRQIVDPDQDPSIIMQK